MALTTSDIVCIVLVSVFILVMLSYMFVSWYTWWRLRYINKDIPRVHIDPYEYQGTWYEIAKYPKVYEEGCSKVRAVYTLDNNRIKVENYCFKDDKETVVKGWAYPTTEKGVLGVSFFPGIYSAYTVVYREKDISIVTDGNKNSLWLLSRTSQLTKGKKNTLLQWLRNRNFDTDRLTFTYQGLKRRMR